MNKIIPIISIIVAALCLACGVIGVITMSIAISARGIEVVGIPTSIAALVLAVLSVGVNVLFFKSIICKIAFFINVASLLTSVAAIIIWIAVL